MEADKTKKIGLTKYLSIIVPVFNAQTTIGKCLEAIHKMKDFERCELIVADDGSIDDSIKIAQKYGAKIVVSPANKGAAHTRNLGARVAIGELLFFIDSDVVLLSEDILKYLKEDFLRPDICGIVGIYDEKLAFDNFASAYKHLYMCFGRQVSPELSAMVSSAILAVSREKFLQAGGFDEKYPGVMAEDVEFSIRLALGENKLWRLDYRIKGVHLKKYTLKSLLRTDCSRIRGIAKATQKKGYKKMYLQTCSSYFSKLPFLAAVTAGLLILSLFWPFFIWGALISLFLFFLAQFKFFKYLKEKRSVRFALLAIFFSFFEMMLASFCILYWQMTYQFKKR